MILSASRRIHGAVIIGPQMPSPPFRPVAASGGEDPPVEDRPLLGRIFAYDLERGLQEFDKALKERRFEEIGSMCGSAQPKAKNVFCKLLDASQDLAFARTALESYREKLQSGMDPQTAFMQAAGGLLGAPSAPGGGLSVNEGGLIVGGAFLRKRVT